MTSEELHTLIEKVISHQMEFQTIEVKAAHEGNPKRLYDTLSSFSNQNDGGTLLFGLDENNGFRKVGVYNPKDLQNKLNEQCNEMEPKVRPLITVCEEDGMFFLSAEIPPIDIADRPCYYAGKGQLKGSYIRIGQSDEPMTEYEVFSYDAFRRKYREDIRAVERASFSSLDREAVKRYLLLLRTNKPNLARLDDTQILDLMSMTVNGSPSLSALLLFCPYPQAFFPQFAIIAVSIPGTEIGEVGNENERFADNKRIEGTIEDMLTGALTFLKNNMKVSTAINPETGVRKDLTDYPVTALREVVLNALVHRDYSIHTEGMPIQIQMYTDRVEVKNPGGLYGRLTIDQLGKVQPDTRNPVLATTMEVLGLTENRYSGIPTIRKSMKESGNPDPVFCNTRGAFSVTLYKRSTSQNAFNDLMNGISEEDKEILEFCTTPKTRAQLGERFQFKSISYFIKSRINPLVQQNLLTLSNPSHPKSAKQQYLTSPSQKI